MQFEKPSGKKPPSRDTHLLLQGREQALESLCEAQVLLRLLVFEGTRRRRLGKAHPGQLRRLLHWKIKAPKKKNCYLGYLGALGYLGYLGALGYVSRTGKAFFCKGKHVLFLFLGSKNNNKPGFPEKTQPKRFAVKISDFKSP